MDLEGILQEGTGSRFVEFLENEHFINTDTSMLTETKTIHIQWYSEQRVTHNGPRPESKNDLLMKHVSERKRVENAGEVLCLS